MGRNATVGALLCGIGATMLMTAPASAQQDRISTVEKGSLLIYSKIEIRWDSAGNLHQDTFVSLINDFPEDVRVQFYFVNGDEPLEAVFDDNGLLIERAHDGWNWADVLIPLTQNQPIYWSALTGLPAGVTPFTALDPGFPPGRPDPDGGTDRVLRGFLVGWAVNSDNAQIRWNHLSGSATLVNYHRGSAWEYKAWASQVQPPVAHGAPVGTAGTINLDGIEYAPGFDLLLLDFYAVGSSAFSGGGRLVTLNTDLTLHPIDADLRQETEGPVCTKATFEVWNQNEFKFTGLEICICCWSQRLLSNYPAPNHTLIQNLQTDKGKARIDGLASQLCFIDFDPEDGLPVGDDPRDILSQAASLLGVVAKHLKFDNGLDFAQAGMNLTGMGTQAATIQYDLGTGQPPESENPSEKIIEKIEKAVDSKMRSGLGAR